jgi:hypothetical protein
VNLLAAILGPPAPWKERAACLGQSADLFHPEAGSDDGPAHQVREDRARRYCAQCPVRRPCLKETLTYETGYTTDRLHRLLPVGIYGGLNPSERWDKRVKHLPLPERVEALEALFVLRIAPRLLAPGESVVPSSES